MYLNTDQFNTSYCAMLLQISFLVFMKTTITYVNVNFRPHKPPKLLFSSLHFCSIDLIEVFESLSSLSSTFSPGPDLIPSTILRNFTFVILPPLFYLFNLSLSTSIFPNTWKTNCIHPILFILSLFLIYQIFQISGQYF